MSDIFWQLKSSVSAIVFDCDGTLSSIEGIDALAENKKVSAAVSALTAEAMGKTGINAEIYQQRLNMVKPSQKEVDDLGQNYFQHRTPDSENVLQLLTRLEKKIYIISAGLEPAVMIFGELLKVPPQQIFSVAIKFDEEGHYQDFDRTSPLVTANGKRDIISEIKKQHEKIIFVGDGMNDISAKDLVERFIGFGGAYYRENIAALSDFYIKKFSFMSLLPLCLTQEEWEKLNPAEKKLFQQGLTDLENREVLIQNKNYHFR